ncbi:pectate lyase B [Colletotrichum falcatum]|nr:pectate lyase B [Colletotrichum falcatum]
MKFSVAASLAALAALAGATPTPTVQKRATLSDACELGYGAGTTGGSGGATITVSTAAELTAAAKAPGPAVIVVQGAITGAMKIHVTSDKSIIGLPGSSLTGVGFYVIEAQNVILRNLRISKVLADNGDAIGIQTSSNVWVDHCDLSSDRVDGKDFYDGLLDITHGSTAVTVSNTYLHDHDKTSLVGHSDLNAAQDEGRLFVTYANNYWRNVGSRAPSVRFGTVHVFNNYEEAVDNSGVNTRDGAQVLVESSVFSSVKRAITSYQSDALGYAVASDVDLGNSTDDAPKGTFVAPPYPYTKLGSANVKAAIVSSAGQTLVF